MARKASFPGLSHADAISALRWLVATKRISVREIRLALAKRDALIREIKLRLEALGGERLRHLGAGLLRRPSGSRRRRRLPSARARVAWKLQGQYMAAVRRIPKAARARIKAIREKSGVRAAIAAARKAAR
jgi:hypothetical protein